MSVSDICRLCLTKIEHPLKPDYRLKNEESVTKEIETIFGFEMASNPRLPQEICAFCSDLVKTFYQYFMSVLQNQEKLAAMIDEKLVIYEEYENEMIIDSSIKEEEEIQIKTVIDEDETSNVIDVSSEGDQTEVGELETDNIKTESPKKIPDKQQNAKVKQKRKQNNIERINTFIEFKCCHCPSMKFEDLRQWRSHMKSTHQEDNPPYFCCNKKFPTEKRILLHITRHHDTTPPKFICAKCLRGFKHKKKLERHLQSHIQKRYSGYTCKKCPDVFRFIRQWQRHQLLHSPHMKEDEVKFPCKKCDGEFPTMKALEQHLRIGHKKKLLCDHCAKEFYCKDLLQRHVRRQHTENPDKYTCETCGTELATIQSYKQHIKLLHEAAGEYPCGLCDKVAITESQLRNHIRYAHELEYKFECTYCAKLFKRANELADHISIHTGISRHMCPKCERKFNNKSNMQSHAKRCQGTLKKEIK
uniref:CSON001162 protein n=1 Tax=Culicoides sonorensis TaxID=179676 RepID=A0A336L701_CULSO